MEAMKKRSFARQMYTADSEVGKMKLQSVKENLYEATTKVVLYSIEMYTKMMLQDWVRTCLIQKLDKTNNVLKRGREELEQGNIGMFDITNGCAVINDFVRKEALALSRNELQEKIELQKKKITELEEKECILEKRKMEIEVGGYEEEEAEIDDYKEVNDFFYDENDDDTLYEDSQDEESEYYSDTFEDEVYDEGSESEKYESVPMSEIELFTIRITSIKNPEDIENISEELKEEKYAIEILIKELNSLTKNGNDILTKQHDSERESLNNLRTLRNTVFAHKSEDKQEISLIGSWEPEAGPLYQWATEILTYIKIIESRYKAYAWFDDFYASREGKDKFDGCKVYVQKQIKELYVNRSSIILEFDGELYDKEDEELNFKKLIESMAISWDTGIRYLTVVTNEDMPELNVFFKECLSGTNKYVDYYLIYRNELRDSYNINNSKDVDYLYFKLLYHLNPSMEKIYWRDRAYTKKEFARQVLYKFIKVKNMFQFDARLKNFEKYIDGIDVKKWCEHHLLSEIYFAGIDDLIGQAIALEMENAIVDFSNHSENKGRLPLYRRAIKASVQLYFHMGEDYVFSYTRSDGHTFRWRSLEEACKYIENSNRFKSYTDLSGFVDEMYKSDYFRIWRNKLKERSNKRECEV